MIIGYSMLSCFVPTLVSGGDGCEWDGPALLDAVLVGDADHLGPRPPEAQPPDLVVGVLRRLLRQGDSRQEQDRLKGERYTQYG